MKIVKLIILVVILSVLFSCKTSTEPEKTYHGITETDKSGRFTGNIDTSDWSAASYDNVYFAKNLWINPGKNIYMTAYELGLTEHEEIRIFNYGKSSVNINLSIDDPFVCISQSTSIAKQTLGSIIVMYTPEDSLSHQDSLFINLSNSETCAINVEVMYHGWIAMLRPYSPHIFYPSYPNPTSGIITFSFYLKEPQSVTLNIKNESGTIIKNVLSVFNMRQGKHSVNWNLNEDGIKPGIYRASLESGGLTTYGDIQVIE